MESSEWLTAADIALACGTDPQTVVRHLGRLGLIGTGSAPSPMALRHDLAVEASDYAHGAGLWHEDVYALLSATGLEKTAAPVEYSAEPLFDEEDVSPIERARSRAKSAPADVPSNPPTNRTGPHVPGADLYGFEQVIATDGACSGNPGPGGWAWVDELTGQAGSGGSHRTTNNIMELTAMLEALRYADRDKSLLIRADSQYVINVVTKWGPTWRRKGWKKADGKPVANQELVAALLEEYEKRTAKTRIDWVRGHDGDAGNEQADRLAVAERDRH
ncbi:ribonuclease H family protein [Flaviflexus huanghaiensis]|uniref:ribonuclease H family protein n=1 Tax=Flaviflexus huanghaiensis TaxID=1111473 RepID=UPI0015F9526C|nr:ribonuclease H [Flaviflexus huanghaiensis]